MSKSVIKIYTDGGANIQTKRGGWAVAFTTQDSLLFDLSGMSIKTTNNQMELTAILSALEYIQNETEKQRSGYVYYIYSDSKYCVDGYNSWVKKWEQNSWKTVKGGDVLNLELWKRLNALRFDNVKLEWVKGHSGNYWNEYCDKKSKEVRD